MAGSHSTATRQDEGTRDGWVSVPLVLFCLASAGITLLAGLVQVTFGSFPMTPYEVWGAVFDPDVVFDRQRVADVVAGDF